MPLLKGLNFILLIRGSQLGLVYQDISAYQAPLSVGERAPPLPGGRPTLWVLG